VGSSPVASVINGEPTSAFKPKFCRPWPPALPEYNFTLYGAGAEYNAKL